MATLQNQSFNGGNIACNPGQRHTVKLGVIRAAYENVSNALNATADAVKGVGVVEVLPRMPHPLSLEHTGEDCFAVISNSYLDPKDYRSAINYGRTRGTDQGNDTQAIGNDQGVGMKESAFSLGGNPGFMSCKKVEEGKYTMCGWIVHDDLMDLRVKMDLSSEQEISYVTFKVIIWVSKDGVCRGELVYPKLNKPESEYYDKIGLFCTGLPFCKEDTHYSLNVNGHLDSDESFVTNKNRFVQACVLTFKRMIQWTREKLHSVSQEHSSRLYHDYPHLEDCMQECSISFCHSMQVPIFFQAVDKNPVDMTDDFKRICKCHKWCMKGHAMPLSTALALQINWKYFDVARKTAFVFLEGIDIRSANVYLPLLRASENIMKRKGETTSPFAYFTIANEGNTFGQISFCTVVKSNTNVGSILRDVDDDMECMPRVQWNEDGTALQTWEDWSRATTRDPPVGVFITRGSGVINPMGATDYWFNCEKYISGQEGASSRLQKSMNFAINRLEDARRSAGTTSNDYGNTCMHGTPVVRFLCHGMGIKAGHVHLDVKGNRRVKYFPTSHLERALVEAINKNALRSPMTECSEVMYTAGFVEAMTMTKQMNDKVNFFPEASNSSACKNFVQRMFGATSCGIFDVNPDMFSVNQEKTCITPITGVVSTNIVASIFAASSVYSMCFDVPEELQYRLNFILNNDELFKTKFVDNRSSDPGAHQSRVQSTTLETTETNYSALTVKEWIACVRKLVDQNDEKHIASELTYYKDPDHKGWKIEVKMRPSGRSSDTETTTTKYDMYFKHYEHGKKFAWGGKLRAEIAVEWFIGFCSRNFKIETDHDMYMCKKHLEKSEFMRLCREQGIHMRLDGDAAEEIQQSDHGTDGSVVMQQQSANTEHGCTAKDASGAALVRKKRVISEQPSEALVRMWYNEHPYDDPLFVYGSKVVADEARVRKMVAILGRLSDNMGSPESIFNVEDVICLLGNFMSDTSSAIGKRRLNISKAKTGVSKKSRLALDLSSAIAMTPHIGSGASSSSDVTQQQKLATGRQVVEELD